MAEPTPNCVRPPNLVQSLPVARRKRLKRGDAFGPGSCIDVVAGVCQRAEEPVKDGWTEF